MFLSAIFRKKNSNKIIEIVSNVLLMELRLYYLIDCFCKEVKYKKSYKKAEWEAVFRIKVIFPAKSK